MCMGESTMDTLSGREQSFLRTSAEAEFPHHAFALRSNEDGIHWVVLEPSVVSLAVMRFTICRIDPGIVVMVEDTAERRQFCSAGTIEDAVAFVRNASDQAMLAVMNAHPAPATTQ